MKLKICLVAAFPPSGRQLNEYAFHIARELRRNDDIELTVLAESFRNYEFATDPKTERSSRSRIRLSWKDSTSSGAGSLHVKTPVAT